MDFPTLVSRTSPFSNLRVVEWYIFIQILIEHTVAYGPWKRSFNCTKVGQASDSMTALTKSFNRYVDVWCLSVAWPTVAQIDVFLSSDYL